MTDSVYGYAGTRRVCYGPFDESWACLVPVCPKCGRFVIADATLAVDYRGPREPNGTCRRDGRVAMLFDGFFDLEDLAS